MKTRTFIAAAVAMTIAAASQGCCWKTIDIPTATNESEEVRLTTESIEERSGKRYIIVAFPKNVADPILARRDNGDWVVITAIK